MDLRTLDRCPGYNLYIGGFISLRRKEALKNCNITHIVSVIDWKFDDGSPLVQGYRHLHIPVDDVEDENLLEWFPRSNAFIQEGIDHWKTNGEGEEPIEKGSGVLIHCAMGKSRSATVLLAYLLWSSRQQTRSTVLPPSAAQATSEMVPLPRKPLTVVEALELLRQGRAIAEPNEGFMDQLHMYEDMGCPTTDTELTRHKIYRRWMNKRSVEESLRVNQAPEMESIRFEDESDEDDADGESSDDVDASNSRLSTAVQEQRQTHPSSKSEAKVSKGQHMQRIAPGISAPDGSVSQTPTVHSSSQQTRQQQEQVTLKCRKCRHILATTQFITAHSPPPHRDPSSIDSQPISPNSNTTATQSVLPPSQCAHIFLHPLSWMREVLSEGAMEGRLTCPNRRCGTNVGKFSWSGLRCSCGGWVTPGFGIIRGKVDEIVARQPSQEQRTIRDRGPGAAAASGKASGSSGSALRMPPAMRRGNL